MIKRLGFVEQCMVRIVCAIALLFIGLAHQPPVVPPVIDARAIPPGEIAAYTLPDGTAPVLCLAAADDHGHHHQGQDEGKAHGRTGCEACRLTATLALPCPVDAVGQPVTWQVASFHPPRDRVVLRKRIQANTAPRGPPQPRLA